MTIIQPHRHSNTTRFFVFLLAVFIVGAILFIFEYNAFVGARFAESTLKNDIANLETETADLKSRLYGSLLDPRSLQEAAAGSGLVLEKRPTYLTVSSNQ